MRVSLGERIVRETAAKGSRSYQILEKRDAFIAQSIDSTLKDGETGLLFIGASHYVLPKVPKEIDVKLLNSSNSSLGKFSIELGIVEAAEGIKRYIQVKKMRACRHRMEKHQIVVEEKRLSVLGPIY